VFASFDEQTISKRIQWSYVIIIASIVLWIIGEHLVLRYTVVAQEHYAELINISGMQRMLSQKIALVAVEQHHMHPKPEQALQQEFQALQQRMADNHQFLLHHIENEAITALFLQPPAHIDQAVQQYLTLAAHFQKTQKDEDLVTLLHFSTQLLPKLDQVVTALQHHSEHKTHQILRLEQNAIILVISMLILEMLLLIRPLIKQFKRAIKTIHNERHRYKTLLSLSSDGLFIMDPITGRLIEYSGMVRQLLGYSDAELQQLTVFDWDHEITSLDDYHQIVAQIGEQPLQLERIHTRKDGSTYHARTLDCESALT
jgi:PAS domain S-box-containing protein